MRQEVAQQRTEVAQPRRSVHALTSELAQFLQCMPQPSTAAHPPRAALVLQAARSSMQIHSNPTPRTVASQGTAVLLIWPRIMVGDHYKALRFRILAQYLGDADADAVVPNLPKSANRNGVTFPTHSAAALFPAAFRENPYFDTRVKTGGRMQLRAAANAPMCRGRHTGRGAGQWSQLRESEASPRLRGAASTM